MVPGQNRKPRETGQKKAEIEFGIIDRAAAAGREGVCGSVELCRFQVYARMGRDLKGDGYLGGQLVCDKDDIYGHWSPKGRMDGVMQVGVQG